MNLRKDLISNRFMKLSTVLTTAGFLVAGGIAATGSLFAQGPLYDKVIVDLPYRVTLNNTMLEPGHYVIRQLDDPGGGSRVLQVFSDDGMKLRASTLTIPTLDNNTPENTKVILHHYGSDYYFDKIWIQGKNYGYEFPLPESVKARERERMKPVNLAARYVVMAPQQAQNVEPVPEPEAAPPSAEREEVPEAPPAPEPEPTPAPRKMPHTDAGWMAMLLSGGVLSAAGLALRRRR